MLAKKGFLCNPAISNTGSILMDPPKVFTLTPAVFSLSETDSNTSFKITMLEAPVSDVVFDISNPDITEATVSPTQVTFTPANWNIPQQVNITPKADGILDGDQTIYPTVSVNVGLTQNCYTFAEAKTVTISITDVNTPGFEICLLYTSPSPRDLSTSRMPSSA